MSETVNHGSTTEGPSASRVLSPDISEHFTALRNLWREGTLYDTTLVVKGKHHRVHKVILAAASLLLQDKLQKQSSGDESINILEVPDEFQEVIDIALEFLYTGTLGECECFETLQHFSDYFKIQHLSELLLKICRDEDHSPRVVSMTTSSGYRRDMLRKWDKFRQRGLLCDVVLRADSFRFACHRFLLAAFSDYFRAMFTSRMKESKEEEVVLHGICASGLKIMLAYAYSGFLSLDGNIEEIVDTACHLQIQPVITAYTQYAERELDTDNCVKSYQISCFFNFEKLKLAAEEFILSHLLEVSDDDIARLSHSDLESFLTNDGVNIGSELVLFKKLCRWCRHDEEGRKDSFTDLLKLVRLPLIDEKSLLNVVAKEELVMTDRKCKQIVSEALRYHCDAHRQPLIQTPQTRLRTCNMRLRLISVDLKESVKIQCINLHSDSHDRMHLLTCKPRLLRHPAVAVMSDFLYLVGGQSAADGQCSQCAFRYDPRFKTWLQLPSMKTQRAKFFLGICGSKLYAIGGIVKKTRLKKNRILTKSVECYDPEENQWSYKSPCFKEMYGLSGATCRNKLYVIGGRSGDCCHGTLQRYTPSTDSWEELSPMRPVSRYNHSTVTINERLYVIGGKYFSSTNFLIDHLGISCYDPSRDQWEFVSRIPPLSIIRNSRATNLGSDIYIIRQRRCQGSGSQFLQTFDVNQKEWKTKVLPHNFPSGALCILRCNND
ncbi:kelch-like protein 9 [Ptychodera flava]|uniref:kelch-like protein 9 n=1 Tax=Ptychodera flava TaxID=63121 RepID=UPI00396A2408